ncbi:hypothetical protein E2C01_049865 [Portunus trituberculatus]|uniref:Uncharacterized protein n=1 Tax=Portunus trituberculatus TaxID=210409 RepID=A0A5B7G6R0_PORTR|nr:hypothetical protein [Portunus trituberculatus]
MKQFPTTTKQRTANHLPPFSSSLRPHDITPRCALEIFNSISPSITRHRMVCQSLAPVEISSYNTTDDA